jgi:hypothetical protein
MEVMNVIGYAPPSFQRPPRRPRLHRIDTVTLASSISIVALVISTSLHVFANVAEQPLVVGTIVMASIAGWINAFLPSSESAPHDGGQLLLDDDDELGGSDVDDYYYEQAA